MITSCVMCSHPRRAEFEAMLADGRSQTEVASLAGVNQSAVSRHLAKHVLASALLERSARDLLPDLVLRAADPRVRLTELRETLLRGMLAAEAGKDLKSLPRFGQVLHRILELELRHGGNGHRPQTADGEVPVVVEQRGNLKSLAGVIIEALSDHPEARERVVNALAGMATTEGGGM